MHDFAARPSRGPLSRDFLAPWTESPVVALLAPLIALLIVPACGARTALDWSALDDTTRLDATDVPDAQDPLDRTDVPPRDAPDAPDALCTPLDLPPPRLIAPLSTARVSTARVRLRYAPNAAAADGARIEVFRDRAATMPVGSYDAMPGGYFDTPALPRGVLFWRIRATRCGRAGTVATPTWQFTVDRTDAPLPTAWGTVPDFNGDGFADITVGAPGDSTVFVYPGGPMGPSTTPQRIRYFELAQFGWSVASAGDVNGDGFADLIVGSLAGVVHVHAGGPFGAAQRPTMTLLPPPGANRFSYAVASAGDVDADGYGDVIIGSQGGPVWVYLGGPVGIDAGRMRTIAPPADAPLFGTAIAFAGDINADGYGDVIIGSQTAQRAYVYIGSALGLEPAPTSVLTGPVPNADFGYAVACAGDVNNDGFADVAVDDGAPSRAGYVFLGSRSGVIARAYPLGAPSRPEGFLSSISGAGDVNGDGFADVIGSLGSRGPDTALLAFGDATAIGGPRRSLTGSGAGGAYAVAGAGDVNGDGFDDVLAAAANRSAVYVYFGGARASDPAPSVVLAAPAGAREFGTSLASVGR